MNNEINTPEYIYEIISTEDSFDERLSKFKLSMRLSFKTLIFGRKWLVYLGLAMIPVLASFFSADSMLGNQDGISAFIDVSIRTIVFFLFSFGALLISLPNTSDEIADNVMEGYVVRPISRTDLYLSKTFVNIIGLWLVNCLILTIYYIYFQAIDFANFDLGDTEYLLKFYFFMFWASIMYGAIFSWVGMIGSNGFTFGIILAMFETFFVNLLFLQDNKYLPRTNLTSLADEFFDTYFTYGDKPRGMGPGDNYFFFIVFTITFLLIGMQYFKQKEFDG